jgi:ribosome-associated protein
MRKLKDVLAAQERAQDDDRVLRSRSDARKERLGEADALMRMARELSGLSDRQVARLQLSEDLREVVLAARQITSPTARNRHMKVIRRVLRALDWEQLHGELQEVLAPGRRSFAVSTEVDRWLERLQTEGDPALEVFSRAHPDADRTQLRQLLRQLARAAPADRMRARRKLAACLHEVIAPKR